MVVSVVNDSNNRRPVLARYREQAGLSQAELARSFDVLAEMIGAEERMANQQTISRIENGDRELTLREAMLFGLLLKLEPLLLFPQLNNQIVAIGGIHAQQNFQQKLGRRKWQPPGRH